MDYLDTLLSILASLLAVLGVMVGAYYGIKKYKTRIDGAGISNNNEGDSRSVNESSLSGDKSLMIIGDHNVVNTSRSDTEQNANEVSMLKLKCNILFIDDEEFNVIKMLQKAGWRNVNKVSDIVDFDCSDLRIADIVFVDIKGVGIELGFKNEGIGLAAEIKRKFPNKGVILYSATPDHPLFDPDINEVDDKLPKNAEPIEFQNMIEQYGSRKN